MITDSHSQLSVFVNFQATDRLCLMNAWRLTQKFLIKRYTKLPSNTSVQFNSVAQSCLILCNPMNSSTPGLPVHHVSDAIQPSHPLLSSSPLAFNLSQHQGLFQRVSQSKGLSRVFRTTVQSNNSLALNFLYSPPLTSIHDYWKNHSLTRRTFCWQSNVSAFQYIV